MNNQEIFTLVERDENTNRKRELIDHVASREAVLIVGAGSSVRVDYPDWHCLLKELKDLANKCGNGFKLDEEKNEGDPLTYLEYAENIKLYICKHKDGLKKYYALLQNLFGPKDPPYKDFHRKLVSLPFRGILTTNYDTVLEAALGEIEPSSAYDNSLIIDGDSAGRVCEFLMAMNNDKRMTRRIAHLHGKFDPASSIILSIEDYKHSYGLKLTTTQVQSDSEWTLHRKLLWAVLATRRVVFVGFSMDDPYFNQMLKTVSTDLWEWDKSIHFAIMDISLASAEVSKDKADRLKREYGVDTVFYEVLNNSHQRLEHIVAEIAEKCGVEIQPTIIPQERPDDKDSRTDEKPASVESESGDVLDWLERVNQRMGMKINDGN